EAEIVGVEETFGTVGEHPRTEPIAQRGKYMRGEIAILDAGRELDRQRHVAGWYDRKVVADPSVILEHRVNRAAERLGRVRGADGTVANSISRVKARARLRPSTILAVPETQVRRCLGLDFDNVIRIVRPAVEEIEPSSPGLGRSVREGAVRRGAQTDLRQAGT